MNYQILRKAEERRKRISKKILAEDQIRLGQYFTPDYICKYLVDQFSDITGEISVLDPGAGIGMLTAGLVDRIINEHGTVSSCKLTAFEVERSFIPDLEETLDDCKNILESQGITTHVEIINKNFLTYSTDYLNLPLFSENNVNKYTHIITNPPYRKIRNNSTIKKILISSGINTVNFYSAFIWISMMNLQDNGEIVAITPRSFCNGTYYFPFRKAFLESMTIDKIHIFSSRKAAFSEADVLQENIIFHATKNTNIPEYVNIIQSEGRNAKEEKLLKTVSYEEIVHQNDPEKYIFIPINEQSSTIRTKMESLVCSLRDLGVNVSTGPVVDFRLRDKLCTEIKEGYVPLIYAQSIKSGNVRWPIENGKKNKSILVSDETVKWLIKNNRYVLLKRFTSKEEKRRIVAGLLQPIGDYPYIGIENHVNYFYSTEKEMDLFFAKGLVAFLNSTLFDNYYRLFSGHTQINVTDLRRIKFPNRNVLEKLGIKIDKFEIEQYELDKLLEETLNE